MPKRNHRVCRSHLDTHDARQDRLVSLSSIASFGTCKLIIDTDTDRDKATYGQLGRIKAMLFWSESYILQATTDTWVCKCRCTKVCNHLGYPNGTESAEIPCQPRSIVCIEG